ncbi:tRNA pseudouridine(55) synthase TruB [Paraglaciecola sp. MB-3u-78]|uniref:tRNA pseudouridine(55) synthase TruB n=1 Tax=Paraglaciecola sp. MB-3u-78 TaxID=2058332 RepID=UPI000C349E44|nr:tRNA pseudouridine(55) synthase TruB [Paraglaciecola sp. MB-3u-78]PKG99298.1 tRNA pseudouridine(55) synthase TruB [Paraglaciecola sp. MB-3u-78]
MARTRKGRAVNGIILLNKGLCLSSNHALQQVKRMFNAAKAGHTGALDPLATGMLPICLGEATKFSQFLLETDKTYQVTAKLGVRTTTSDADGEVVETLPVNVTEAQLFAACEQFKGPIKQVPSMFSALKHQGKPLYFYARQGIDIPREARDITIFSLSIDRFAADEVDMTVHSSKGTYIRSLVDDLGQVLGCGAYVSKLHRTQVTDYPADKMMTMESLQALRNEIDSEADVSDDQAFIAMDQLLMPMDSAVKTLDSAELERIAEGFFRNGNPVNFMGTTEYPEESLIRAYSQDSGLFLGVGFIDSDGKIAPKRSVVYT